MVTSNHADWVHIYASLTWYHFISMSLLKKKKKSKQQNDIDDFMQSERELGPEALVHPVFRQLI